MYGENYPMETKACLDVPRMTLTERLLQERNNVKTRLDELDAVINVLQQNPQIKEVLDLLQKTRCI